MPLSKRAILCDQIARLSGPGNRWPQKLPPIRRLAELFGVSPVTINAALQTLVEQKKLQTIPGKSGYFAISYTPPGLLNAHAADESISDRLLNDLLNGTLPVNEPLPGVKGLCVRYSCHYASLRKALKDLTIRGILERRQKRFHFKMAAPRATGGTYVYLIGAGRLLHASNQHVDSFVASIERMLENAGWDPLRHVVAHSEEEPTLPDPGKVSAVIFPAKPSILKPLSRMPRVPMVTIAPGGITHNDSKLIREYLPETFLIEADNRLAGRTAGALLARLGHCHIAFICDASLLNQPWVAQRIDGLAELYPFETRHTRSLTIASARQTTQSAAVQESLRALRMLRRNARAHPAQLPPEVLSEAFRRLWDLFSLLDRGATMADCFGGLLENKRITAWVCLNDDMALLALAFLHANNKTVPEHVSLVGFDNTLNSWLQGISSYDFGFDRIGHITAHAIMNPALFRRRYGLHMKAPGNMLPRRSAGRART